MKTGRLFQFARVVILKGQTGGSVNKLKRWIYRKYGYSDRDIAYFQQTFPEISFWGILEGIAYASMVKRKSPEIEDVTFQVRELELYKEDVI